MILVGAVALTEEEWALGQGVTSEEFNAIYRPWLGRVDMAAPEEPGRARKAPGGGAGKSKADHPDDAADRAGQGEGAAQEASEWLGDSCSAIDRVVYGGAA